jgi:hypothetical protein
LSPFPPRQAREPSPFCFAHPGTDVDRKQLMQGRDVISPAFV